MKPTDKITLELTGHQLAKIYALQGNVNGACETSCFESIKSIIDLGQKKYDKFFEGFTDDQMWDYHLYGQAWEDALFSKPESAAQNQLNSVMDRIKELTEQAEVLKKLIDKE